MEALLPSEIARLVLGYLEDQKCTDAAKLFLETSPHLQECRTVLSHGRRFSTRVNGLTLIDVIEKLSAINAMIQERLNKITDCEQLKHCGDLIEQLKFLVEEPRGQRFVSNTQTSNGSPTITCNVRKRRHSNSERIKRIIKSQSNAIQQSDIIMSPPSSHNIDTTPLESLPGNIHSLQQAECSIVEKRDENVSHESHKQCDFDKNNSENIVCNRNNIRISSDDISSIRNCEMDIDDKKKEESSTANITPKRYTTATSTEELLSFSSTEVQTIPYEIHESESESNDEPIENLSILTKEILNRTDLQECIAENINKAIIPTDISLKDENLNDSVEGNTSIMAELNSAIKSIVEATEADPVFEKFLDEIIGPHTETDTSPEEDGEGKLSPKSVNESQEQQGEPVLSNINSPEPMITDVRAPVENDTVDVPLKHRLRSSSRQQCNRIEDEVDKVRDQEKEHSALEDQNAAAILSIINANIINNAPETDKRTFHDPKESVVTNDNSGQKIQTMVSTLDKDDISLASVQKPNDIMPSTSNTVQSKVRKPTVKRPRATKPKRDQAISNSQPITEQEIMTMPTLILCSKEEVNNLLINRSSTIKSSSSRFIPIAPKDSNKIKETVETVYLKTVNVAQKPIAATQPVVVEEANNFVNQVLPQGKNSKISKELKTVPKFDTTVPVTIINQQVLDQPQIIESMSTGKIAGDESITLYGNETSAKTSLDGTNMPMINLEENISMSESGLSPYLKFNCNKTNQSHNLSDIDLAPMMENARKRSADNDATEKQQSPNADIIAKRTPKSLLKSRSKNHRLSLSTPRKRSSHVRALDFSTPTMSSARKASGEGNNTQFLSSSTKRLKSVCRTSLFRSPLSSTSTQKQKSPIKVCQPYRIPIATRSPAPKLMGGWDKYNGVGVIIGEVSPHGSASCSSSEDKTVQHKPSKAVTESWDADLRKSIQLNKKDEVVTKKPGKRKRDSIKEKNDVHMNAKYSPRSTKSKKRKTNKIDRKSSHDAENIEENETEENSQDNTYRTAAITEGNNEEENLKKTVINTADSTTNKPAKVLKSASIDETSVEINSTSALNSNTVIEKKPVKKYAQLKTITTNLRKSDDQMKKKTEDAQISEISRILSVDSTQHTCSILRLPDMISLETPRKFDNMSGPPPTPRVLSPSSNIVTPFIKISEDSSKIRSFITTPEFPITPCVALTPKEETTRDIKGEYNSSYYKPKSEQVQDSELSKPRDSSLQESPIISSSHISLHSTHNSLTSGNTYQTSKLEITQFEVIKENLPREEAIKELKIASSSKDSDLNASIVIDRHVDLIEINEFKGVSEINDNYVADSHNNPHNDSAESNSSSSSDTSSSSSSSSTSSSNTDTSTSGSSNCDKAQSKTSTDTSNDFAEKGINASKNERSTDIPIDTCKKSDNDLIEEQESSPQKVFAIVKTDEQIEATMKETPVKDETLLNEAVISETPSSSKSGMEHFTNLSTKISAIITEDEKLSKVSKPSKDNNKIQINKLKAKPKIISMQYIRPGSSKIVIEPEKEPVKDHHRPEHDKVMQQLEEKRQRMIAKIKDTSKPNLSKVTKRKCISNALKKIGREPRKTLPIPKSSLKKNANKDVNKNAKCEDKPQKISTINTRKRYQQQKLNFVHKCCDNEEDRKKNAELKNAASNLTNYGNKPLNDHTKKQSYKGNICAENNLAKNQNKESESLQSHKTSSSENQEYLKEKSNVKENTEKSCSVKSNSTKEEGEKLQDNTKNAKSSEQEVTSTEHIVQKTSTADKAKQEICDQPEDKTNKPRHFASHPDKSECFKILRYKVDQVKRDLFSDEESDHRSSSAVSEKTSKEVINTETENLDLIEIPSKRENVNPENPKQELSSVLQCLRLVPAYKNENLHNGENQIEEQHEEQSEYENKDNVNNELHQAANIHHYKAEYHFVHDDSAPIRKRRRRYSAHELQIEINHADVSDPNISSPIECIRIMKASDFEEIFNLAPKSKKRAISKRSPTKNDKGNEMDKDAFTLKEAAKPLATSSPVEPPTDKLSKTKLKKMITKTATTNRTDTNTQSEARKKQKVDKHQEKVSDTAKSRKRKLSETKETKQIEKKPCLIDPQMLLNNMNKEDLNNLLDKVHGPV
ncbi:bromodomain-containing protein DDB_G0270170-like isoform X2 [Linepithema humile]|uniref:bromodomain-containing protein DDB_G0270170-like isoform X2 n=1 Tax=Linepithema humile TaxID=83485 RepID=UPI00351EAA1A